jgi:hypothetical protein
LKFSDCFIDDVYARLRDIELVTNGTEFSREWLGMEGSYLRTLKSKKRTPSAGVLARCAVRLESWSKAYSGSSHSCVNDKAVVLSELAESCWDAIEEIGRSGR